MESTGIFLSFSAVFRELTQSFESIWRHRKVVQKQLRFFFEVMMFVFTIRLGPISFVLSSQKNQKFDVRR